MSTAASSRDIAAQILTRDVFFHVVYLLDTSLPAADDTPEAQALRMDAAIAQVAALLPTDATEAVLAARVVAAGAQSFACLRAANDKAASPILAIRNVAQAAGMMRLADATLKRLHAVQAARGEARSVGGGLSASMVATPAPPPAPAAVAGSAASPSAPAARPVPPPPAPTTPAPPPPAPSAAAPPREPQPVAAELIEPKPQAATPSEPAQAASPQDALAAAERFAQACPRRATLIRRLSRVSENSSIPTPGPAVLNVLMNGQTPILRKLDRKVA